MWFDLAGYVLLFGCAVLDQWRANAAFDKGLHAKACFLMLRSLVFIIVIGVVAK